MVLELSTMTSYDVMHVHVRAQGNQILLAASAAQRCMQLYSSCMLPGDWSA